MKIKRLFYLDFNLMSKRKKKKMMEEVEERIWTEKYRPTEFGEIANYGGNVKVVKRLINSDDFPHILLYGPPGAGKRTFTRCILNELFGPDSLKLRSEIKEYKVNSTLVEFLVLHSNHHIEISSTDNEIYDRVIVNNMIKETAESQPIKKTQSKAKEFKVVVVHDLDILSRSAQAGLRRTMEKYMSQCRIIFHCESLSRVIQPLKSRCVQIRIPSPSYSNIGDRMKLIADKEGLSIDDKTINLIAKKSRRNMRKAIMLLQIYANNLSYKKIDGIISLEYEKMCMSIVEDIKAEQSPSQLKTIRTKIYQLFTKSISEELIFVTIVRYLLAEKFSSEVKYVIIDNACEYDFRAKIGSRLIVHLEAFIMQVMLAIRKASIANAYGWPLKYK